MKGCLKEPSARSNSYSRKSRSKGQSQVKANQSLIYYMKDHLFQGQIINQRKQGEGAMILKNGDFILGNWFKGYLNGYVLIISPLGAKIHANFNHGIMDGWSFIQFQSGFLIIQYFKGQLQSRRLRFQQSDSTWTQSLYNTDNKLLSILSISYASATNLPHKFYNQDLSQLLDVILRQKSTLLRLDHLSAFRIGSNYQYYGFTNDRNIPHGLGALFSKDQVFVGKFNQGNMDKFAQILFPNGILYKGQIQNGQIKGQGLFYDFNTQNTKFVEVSQEGNQRLIKQIEGCHIDKLSFGKGQSIMVGLECGLSLNCEIIYEQITKNYHICRVRDDNSAQISEESSFNRHGDQKQENTEMPQIKLINSSKKSIPILNKQSEPILPSKLKQKPKPEYPYKIQLPKNSSLFKPIKLRKIGEIIANSVQIAEKTM